MKLKKTAFKKMLKRYLLEQEENKKSESKIVKISNFTKENNEATFMINLSKKTMTITIPNNDISIKNGKKDEILPYLNLALVYVEEKKDIDPLLDLSIELELIKEEEKEIHKNFLLNNIKPSPRSNYVNNKIFDKKGKPSIPKAQIVFNNIFNSNVV